MRRLLLSSSPSFQPLLPFPFPVLFRFYHLSSSLLFGHMSLSLVGLLLPLLQLLLLLLLLLLHHHRHLRLQPCPPGCALIVLKSFENASINQASNLCYSWQSPSPSCASYGTQARLTPTPIQASRLASRSFTFSPVLRSILSLGAVSASGYPDSGNSHSRRSCSGAS
jgi:hypothetical protein